VEVLSASDLTRERIARLAELGRAVDAGEVAVDAAEESLRSELPSFGVLIDRVPPRMRRAVVKVLLFAVGALAQQTLAEVRDHSATPQDVRQTVEQVCRYGQPPGVRP
jgi:hypothetical protein